MKKQFNITGVCIPEKHYMVDISGKTAKIFDMIEQGDYFVINRPRQYGKTTTIDMLDRLLKTSAEYFPIEISFEGIGEEGFKSADVFIEEFFILLKQVFATSGNEALVKFLESGPVPNRFSKLDFWIGELVRKTGKKIVLMIDEVDKSSNNQLFLDFLGMLRNKYLKRDKPGEFTFHSVILVGVHDIKSLKTKIRRESEPKFNSPWNIAVDFEVDLSFSAVEIRSMLEDYAGEQQVSIDIPFFAEKLFYYTSGYPFLVSLLCKILHEKILPAKEKKEWREEDLEQAVQITLKKDNTNFESLIKNLENNPDLYEFVFNLIMNGAEFLFNLDNPIILSGKIYGILKEEKGKVKIDNRLYAQRIYNYMASKLETSGHVTFDHKKYIIELKIWRGEAYHREGIRQLCRYLDLQNLTPGYLLIYDLRKESGQTGKSESIETEGKKIFAAWV